MEHKTCRVCGETKPIEEYPRYKGGRLVRSACSPCHHQAAADWKRANLHCRQCRRYRPRAKFQVDGVESPLCADCRGDDVDRSADVLREEYDFARSVLGKSHEAAYSWVQEQVGCSDKSMERAGLRMTRPLAPNDVEPEPVELRECRQCKRLKTLDEMGTAVVEGRKYHRYVCLRCMADKAKARRHQQAAEQGRTLRPRRMREF